MLFNVVVADMLDKDWAMILRISSQTFCLWAVCTMSSCIVFYLRVGGKTANRNVERIRR